MYDNTQTRKKKEAKFKNEVVYRLHFLDELSGTTTL